MWHRYSASLPAYARTNKPEVPSADAKLQDLHYYMKPCMPMWRAWCQKEGYARPARPLSSTLYIRDSNTFTKWTIGQLTAGFTHAMQVVWSHYAHQFDEVYDWTSVRCEICKWCLLCGKPYYGMRCPLFSQWISDYWPKPLDIEWASLTSVRVFVTLKCPSNSGFGVYSRSSISAPTHWKPSSKHIITEKT